MINHSLDKNLDLRINTCIDNISMPEIEKNIEEFYRGKPTKNVLWDMTNASINNLSTADVNKLASMVTDLGHSRDGGKTAIVASQDLLFGFSRMFGSLSSSKNHIAEIQVFRKIEEAIAWIKDDISA